MTEKPDDRSLLAKSTEWATNASTVAAEMVVPIVLGAWLDSRLGLKGLFAILGGVIGVSTGIWSLLKMVEPMRRKDRPPSDPPNNSPPPSP